MDLVPAIYHETQEPGSMLCAQHALNNLLQSSLFTPQDLADIARRLDQLEADHLDAGAGSGESHNYDDSGFFSIMVMEEALKVLGLRLVRWKSEEMAPMHDNPEQMEGFVLNHQLHWYTIRRFSTEQRWYNLDSCTPTAAWISPMFLGLTLREAELQGYSILAVLPTSDAQITGLPSCDATDKARTLPPPSSTTSSYGRSSGASTNPFQGKGNVLGSASASPSAPRKASSKRRQGSPSPSGSGSGESVEEESEKRRRRPRLGVDDQPVEEAGEPAFGEFGESEEDMMARAISESLKASSLEDAGERKEKRPEKSRAELDEDAELQAAIKASLGEGQPEEEKVVDEVEEDDSPSVEELRRRRLARFGG